MTQPLSGASQGGGGAYCEGMTVDRLAEEGDGTGCACACGLALPGKSATAIQATANAGRIRRFPALPPLHEELPRACTLAPSTRSTGGVGITRSPRLAPARASTLPPRSPAPAVPRVGG